MRKFDAPIINQWDLELIEDEGLNEAWITIYDTSRKLDAGLMWPSRETAIAHTETKVWTPIYRVHVISKEATLSELAGTMGRVIS